ncbi:MAG: T9SS type A sorting domain-containing protein, partial [Candidatus Zixiibacteriota bacterium]
LPVGGPVTSSPILMNLDKDRDVELLVASDDGFIYAWDLPGGHEEDDLPWIMYGYDAGHRNYFPTENLPPITPLAGDLLPERMAFNYPNPAESQTKIRYFLKEDAEVGIRVYDLSGMLVDEFPGPGVGRTHNELPWDCSRFASGVYLCRVEAKSDNESQVVFFKMAIVK